MADAFESQQLGEPGTKVDTWALAWRHFVIAIVYLALFVALDRVIFLLPTHYLTPGWYPPVALSVALLVGISPWYAAWFGVLWWFVVLVNDPKSAFSHAILWSSPAFAISFGLASAFLRRLKVHLRLHRLSSWVWLVLTTICAAMISQAVYSAGVVADGIVPREHFWSAWATGASGALIVISGITPFLLVHVAPWVRVRFLGERDSGAAQAIGSERASLPAQNGKPQPQTVQYSIPWRHVETAAMALSVVLSVWLAFTYQFSQRLDLLYISFVPVVWIGMRRGLRGVVTGLFAFSVVPFLALYSAPTDSAGFLTVRLLLALLSLTGLAVGALVSEREAAHLSLTALTRRFQGMLEKTTERVLLVDVQGRVLFDAGGPKVLGHSTTDYINRSVFDFIRPEDRSALLENFSRLLKESGASARVECQAKASDNTYRWLEVTFTNWLADPAIGGFVLNYRDVTERKTAEEDLRRSEARYRELFENAVFGVYRTTPDGRILDVNPAFVRMLGYSSAEEVRQLHARDLWLNPSERERVLAEYQNSLYFSFVQVDMKRKDGSPLLVRIHGRRVPDSQGNIIYFEGIVEDITDRRKLEEQLRQSQKMEAVGRLAGGVAHDFNNLLSVILGYSEVILDGLLANNPMRRMVAEIKKSADRAAYLTRQLLAFSRKQYLVPKAFNLNVVVHEMTELLGRLIGEDIRLVTHLDPDLKTVRADPSQIEQVIMNLAVNARDAMPNGGELTLETLNINSELHSDGNHVHAGAYVLLRVKDTGIGMDQETQAHAFEPFFTTKPLDKGTGLGLATVYGIVKQSGGQIELRSSPGQGTAFDIYFPVVESVSEAPVPQPPRAAVSRGDQTILVVEDEPALRELICQVLSSNGYTVLDAPDGSSAVRLASTHGGSIHLVLSDIILPGKNGREVADELGRLRPSLRVLFISGYTHDTPVESYDLAGASLLQKPFSPTDLIQKVQAVLQED